MPSPFIIRAKGEPSSAGENEPRSQAHSMNFGSPCAAARWKRSPSQVRRTPKGASHSRVAFSSIALNTGARSPGEELMTCNTSAVAASRASASSRSAVLASSSRRSAATVWLRWVPVSSGIVFLSAFLHHLRRYAPVPHPASKSARSSRADPLLQTLPGPPSSYGLARLQLAHLAGPRFAILPRSTLRESLLRGAGQERGAVPGALVDAAEQPLG